MCCLSSLETRSNFSTMVFWSSCMEIGFVEDPDDRDLVLLEVAEDLAGELVQRDADLLDSKMGSPAILPPPPRSAAGGDGEQVQRRAGQSVDLDPGEARPLVDLPRPAPRTRGVAVGRPVPMPPATIAPPPSSPPPPSSLSTIIAGSRGSSACSSPTVLSRGMLSGSA